MKKTEKKSADNWKGVDLAKNPINWSRMLPKADATARNWMPARRGEMPAATQKAPPTVPVKEAPPMVPVKASSAQSFGEKLANALDMKSIMNTGLGGAALGAGLGGLTGLVAPGQGSDGKRRGRLSGALRGAIGGGLLGGGAGAIGEAASPNFGRDAYNYAGDLYRQLYGRKSPAVSAAADKNQIGTVDGKPVYDGPIPERFTAKDYLDAGMGWEFPGKDGKPQKYYDIGPAQSIPGYDPNNKNTALQELFSDNAEQMKYLRQSNGVWGHRIPDRNN